MRARAFVFIALLSTAAHAQPLAVAPDAASPVDAGSDAALPKPSWPSLAEPTATTSSSSAPRPDPGPGMREAGGRRRGNPASGALFGISVVAIVAYYISRYIKKKMR